MVAIGRVYSGSVTSVSTGTAAMDLVAVYTAAAAPNNPVRVHEVSIGFEGVTVAQMVRIQHRKARGGYVQGSGGTVLNTAQMNIIQPGGAFVTPTATVHASDTTVMAIGSGSLTVSRTETAQVLNGYQFLPNSDEDRPVVAGIDVNGCGYAVTLQALASAIVYDATLVWEELF